MILPSLLAASALVLQASALLIPLEIANAAEAASPEAASPWDSQHQPLELDCPGCLFAGVDSNGVSSNEVPNNVENTISLDFSINKEQEPQTLEINGASVFPFHLLPSPITLDARQRSKVDGMTTQERHIGFALEVLPAIKDENSNTEIIPVQFTVLNLGGQAVKVDTVKIDLLHTEGDQLYIAQISNIPFEETPGADCTNTGCRIQAMIAERIRAMMSAAKAHAHKAGEWVKGGCRGGRKHGVRPGSHAENEDGHPRHHGPHGHHGPPGRHGPSGTHHQGHHGHHGHHAHRMGHRIGHILHKTLRFLVIPALLGVIGGLVASAIGMLVGQALVFLWFRLVRGGQRGNVRSEEVAIEDDEKDALVMEEAVDLPPNYDDVEVMAIDVSKE